MKISKNINRSNYFIHEIYKCTSNVFELLVYIVNVYNNLILFSDIFRNKSDRSRKSQSNIISKSERTLMVLFNYNFIFLLNVL